MAPEPLTIRTRTVAVVDATAILDDGREVPVVRVTVYGLDNDYPDEGEQAVAFLLPAAQAGEVASRIIRHANDAVTGRQEGHPHDR